MHILNRTLVKQHGWTAALFALWGFILVLLAGPGILLAYPLQRWASRQIWNAKDRWKTIWCFAIFGWSSYLPLLLFRAQFVQIWLQVAFLGPASFSSLRFRSGLSLFLIPTVTLLLERIHPQTRYVLIRVKRSGDVSQSPAEPLPAPASTPSAESKQKTIKKSKGTAFSGLILHRPASQPARKRDPRPLGEVLYEEKQRRLRQAKQLPVPPTSAPPPESEKINWDEGEGTYREK